MDRVLFKNGSQKRWFDSIQHAFNINAVDIAKVCKVSSRTVRNWKSENYTVSERAIRLLCKKYAAPFPTGVRLLSRYWYVNKGAIRGGVNRVKKHGPPGTKEGRIKGGLVSQQKRRDNPQKYRRLGCNIIKEYQVLKESEQLAELVGIILGDGSVSKSQLSIYLNSKTDREYALYVCGLIKDVVGLKPSWIERDKHNCIVLLLSGVNLVKRLKEKGIKAGNKVRNKVDFPQWIWKKSVYIKKCLRGLMDTDGGIFYHNHISKGHTYTHIGLCFTNMSSLLLQSFSRGLDIYKIRHTITKQGRIYIYYQDGIKNYFSIFGTSNPKHQLRFCKYFNFRNDN